MIELEISDNKLLLINVYMGIRQIFTLVGVKILLTLKIYIVTMYGD